MTDYQKLSEKYRLMKIKGWVTVYIRRKFQGRHQFQLVLVQNSVKCRKWTNNLWNRHWPLFCVVAALFVKHRLNSTFQWQHWQTTRKKLCLTTVVLFQKCRRKDGKRATWCQAHFVWVVTDWNKCHISCSFLWNSVIFGIHVVKAKINSQFFF